MHVISPCPQCRAELTDALKLKGTIAAASTQSNPFPTVEVDCWPFYEHECPNGHKTRMILQNELYELLFQQAVYCIQDGYYREAIGTFHAALERFMEFATEVLSYKAFENINFNAIWKTIGNQSERQLGAYLITYQLVLRKTPQSLDTNRAHMRNDVVHKERLATKTEAINHGQYVMDYIKAAMSEIRGYFTVDEFAASCSRRLTRLCGKELEYSYTNPIEVTTKEGTMYQGVSQAVVPSFLSSYMVCGHPEYETVEQCIESKSYFGLIK